MPPKKKTQNKEGVYGNRLGETSQGERRSSHGRKLKIKTRKQVDP
jgi:hypothetical protein